MLPYLHFYCLELLNLDLFCSDTVIRSQSQRITNGPFTTESTPVFTIYKYTPVYLSAAGRLITDLSFSPQVAALSKLVSVSSWMDELLILTADSHVYDAQGKLRYSRIRSMTINEDGDYPPLVLQTYDGEWYCFLGSEDSTATATTTYNRFQENASIPPGVSICTAAMQDEMTCFLREGCGYVRWTEGEIPVREGVACLGPVGDPVDKCCLYQLALPEPQVYRNCIIAGRSSFFLGQRILTCVHLLSCEDDDSYRVEIRHQPFEDSLLDIKPFQGGAQYALLTTSGRVYLSQYETYLSLEVRVVSIATSYRQNLFVLLENEQLHWYRMEKDGPRLFTPSSEK